MDLALACEGDVEALGRFFDRHFDRVYAIARRVTGRVDLAQDVAQEVFLKVRRNVARIRTDSDAGPWLHRVTVNACRDQLRSGWWRLSRRSVPLEDAPDLAARGHGGDPERAFARAEDARRVQAALLRLPEDQRISVVLHDFEGLPHEEIARVTRISHAAARKRHSRALRTLSELLEGGESP